MRLINVKTRRLEKFAGIDVPQYAILSHTWGPDEEEISFQDLQTGNTSKCLVGSDGVDRPSVGSSKLSGCCRQAESDGLGYIWIDTCCINKGDSSELSEAINSMFQWYRRASLCYVYLADAPDGNDPLHEYSSFQTSRWFQRGWTLQELLAPKRLRFYDSAWRFLVTRGSMWRAVEKATAIPQQFLLRISDVHSASVAQRMSWAAKRQTARAEDLAYCLLGLFDVTMPMIYGEGGGRAFFRLQEQITRKTRDDSILAWGLGTEAEPNSPKDGRSQTDCDQTAFATAPSDFAASGDIVPRGQFVEDIGALDVTGRSLEVRLQMLTLEIPSETFGVLDCGPEENVQLAVWVPLSRVASSSNQYLRRGSCLLKNCLSTSDAPREIIYIKNESRLQTKPPDHWYWVYHDLADVCLELIDVMPRSRWDEERELIVSTAEADTSHYTLARFRYSLRESPDLLVILELEMFGGFNLAHGSCRVLTCSRDTLSEDLFLSAPRLMQAALGVTCARIGPLNLRVTVEGDGKGRKVFLLHAETLSHLQDGTIDATTELANIPSPSGNGKRGVINMKLALQSVRQPSSLAAGIRIHIILSRMLADLQSTSHMPEKTAYITDVDVNTPQPSLPSVLPLGSPFLAPTSS